MWDLLVQLWNAHQAEIIAMGGGLLAPIALSQTLQIVWFPDEWSPRTDFKVMSLIDFFGSGWITNILWRALDAADGRLLVISGSIVVACCAFLVHLVGLRFALHRWPWLDKTQPPGGAP